MAVVQATFQPQAPPALWVLSCLVLVLLFCALCTTCHRKSKRRQKPGLKLVDVSLLRQTQLRSLSKSDSKLHELHRSLRNSKAQRPTSIDLLYPRWSGGIREDVQMTTAPSVFIHRELPQPPLASDFVVLESPYSNVRLAASSRVPLMTQRIEEQLKSSEKCVIDEYACVRKIKKGPEVGPSTNPTDTVPGERGVQQPGTAAEVEVLYSKVSKVGRKTLEPTWNIAPRNQLVRNTQTLLEETEDEQSQSPAINPSSYRTVSTTWDSNTGNGPTENFYESISEMEGLGKIALPGLQTCRPSEDF